MFDAFAIVETCASAPSFAFGRLAAERSAAIESDLEVIASRFLSQAVAEPSDVDQGGLHVLTLCLTGPEGRRYCFAHRSGQRILCFLTPEATAWTGVFFGLLEVLAAAPGSGPRVSRVWRV